MPHYRRRRNRLDPDEYLYVGLEGESSSPEVDDVAEIMKEHWPSWLVPTLIFLGLIAAIHLCGTYTVGMALWTMLMP